MMLFFIAIHHIDILQCFNCTNSYFKIASCKRLYAECNILWFNNRA